MTPQELKASILQLAIQGKLVEQRAEEGTAEELYQQIQKEKQRLIKAGTIKKEKPLPEITENEIPFDIPEGWKWVRFGELYSLSNGTASRGSKDGKEYPVLRLADLSNNKIESGHIRKIRLTDKEFTSHKVQKDDLVFIRVNGSKDRVATAFHYTEESIISYCDHLFCGHKYSQLMYAEFIMFVFTCPSTRKQLIPEIKTTAGQNTISQGSMSNILLPLPPLAEQKRIVAKIEELLPYVDRYEQAWSRLEDFNRRFPVDMQKSILQMAIQGKLVEQRPEEGTGEELYLQIQQEKQRLIKAGTIKKEKPLPEITEDEIPFDIPEGWKWVRLGILTEMITSGSRDWAQYYSDTGDIFLRMGNLSRNSFNLRLDKIQRVKLPQNAEGKRTSLHAGDLLFSITGEVGTLGLIPDGFGTAYINQHTAMIRFLPCERNRYIPYLLLTDYAQKFYNGNQHGIKNSFRLDTIAMLPIPLPPLAEQKRIVAKLEELLPLCEQLK